MSHEIRTVLTSCGLMVGLNMAPPPPGPIIRKSPGRSDNPFAGANVTKTRRRSALFIGPFELSLRERLEYSSQANRTTVVGQWVDWLTTESAALRRTRR